MFVKEYKINGVIVNVYHHSSKYDKEGFYDLFIDKDGIQRCINLGSPFWVLPSENEVQEFINENGLQS